HRHSARVRELMDRQRTLCVCRASLADSRPSNRTGTGKARRLIKRNSDIRELLTASRKCLPCPQYSLVRICKRQGKTDFCGRRANECERAKRFCESPTISANPVGAASQPVDSCGRTIFVADAHRDDGKRFVARADEKLNRVCGTRIGSPKIYKNSIAFTAAPIRKETACGSN